MNMPSTPPSARLLVVDENPDVVKDLQEIFEMKAYQVLPIVEKSQQVIEVTLAKAQDFRPHVSIVDLRLKDDYDTSDQSGLDLLKQLREDSEGSKLLIYSAYLNSSVDRAIRDLGAEWISKGESPAELVNAVEKLASASSAAAWKIRPQWPPRWDADQLAQKYLQRNLPPMLFNDLILQLVGKPQRVIMVVDIISNFQAALTERPRSASLVVKVKQTGRLLKFADAEAIRQERTRYQAYLQENPKGESATFLDATAIFWDVGAAAYDLLGYEANQPLYPVTHYYRQYSQKPEEKSAKIPEARHKLVQMIRRFYLETWPYSSNKLPASQALFALYDQQIKLKELLEKHAEKQESSLPLAVQRLRPLLPNPYQWVSDNQHVIEEEIGLVTLIHGDFHADNLFTDGESLWATHFERTGSGHLCSDFCQLEVDLLTRLLPVTVNLAEYARLLIKLTANWEPAVTGGQAEIYFTDETQRALDFLCGLRSLPPALVNRLGPQEYVWGLLFHALAEFARLSALPANQIALAEIICGRQRAWLYAAILCKRLEMWGQPFEAMEIDELLKQLDAEFEGKPADSILESVLESADGIPQPGEAMSTLNKAQWKQLSTALSQSFPNYSYLQLFLREELDLSLDNISSALKPMPFVIYDLLQYAEAHTLAAKLIEAAQRSRPNNNDLLALLHTLKIAPSTDHLERILSQQDMAFDVVTFRRRVAQLEGQICRIEIKGQARGTGFLVSPNVVITNYHVIEEILQKKATVQDLQVRFDYKVLDENSTNPGVPYRMANNWLIDHSPYSTIDTIPEPKAQTPNAEELDYALLRLDGAPGNEPLTKALLPGNESVRGFIQLPKQAQPDTLLDSFGENKVLFVMQHPQGQPLKITINTFRSLNSNRTRITYLNNTEPGSSGSPCFNANWQLVALHHSGDPRTQNPQYNEGIPIRTIVALLQERGKLGEVG